MASQRTARGMRISETCLRTSLRLCPSNPLSAYSLGRVEFMAGRFRDAHAWAARAREMYARDGWIPPGCKELLAAAGQHTGGPSRARGV